jgi:hypothetical protein
VLKGQIKALAPQNIILKNSVFEPKKFSYAVGLVQVRLEALLGLEAGLLADGAGQDFGHLMGVPRSVGYVLAFSCQPRRHYI